jgi:acetoin utilization deacetylase AcuC-like enzyme
LRAGEALGELVALDMKVFYSDIFELPLPAGHRFPMAKYRRLRERVAGFAETCNIDLVPSPAARIEELALVHSQTYLDKVITGSLTELDQRRIGFPWSPKMVERSLRSTSATVAAGRAAYQDGIAVHLAGGTHHAFADAGQGFCVFNDVAVAARVQLAEGLARQVLVIDCDVHQGNGTASIFSGDHTVFTFSIHGDRNFPFRKCKGDLDIALGDGTDDSVYLEVLHAALHEQLPLAHADCIYYLAGADPYVGDRLGRLSLTKAGLSTRDELVLGTCRSMGKPVTVVMAGGYARNIDDIVDIHARTVRIAASV